MLLYNKLIEVVTRKDNAICNIGETFKKIEELASYLKKATSCCDIDSFICREQFNNEMLKCYVNDLVDQMTRKEIEIFSQKEHDLKEEFSKKQKRLTGLKFKNQIPEIHFQNPEHNPDGCCDDEMNIVLNSLDVLKKWSDKRYYEIIFDSTKHGDGSDNVLHDKVLFKSKLYFISFDGNNNVYGGYISAGINAASTDIYDSESFVFSLMRDGIVKNSKYPIKKGCEQNAFFLYYNSDALYLFGSYYPCDIRVNKINNIRSFCNTKRFEYNGEKDPLVENYPNEFPVKRVIVLQMY
ncbi:TLDc domain-containing protein [Entamoeba marina]